MIAFTHKGRFIKRMRREAQENIWKNEMNILKHTDKLTLLEEQLSFLNDELRAKGKPASNDEKKRQFVLERNIEGEKKDIAIIEDTKAYNTYLLNSLYPRFLNP